MAQQNSGQGGPGQGQQSPPPKDPFGSFLALIAAIAIALLVGSIAPPSTQDGNPVQPQSFSAPDRPRDPKAQFKDLLHQDRELAGLTLAQASTRSGILLSVISGFEN